MLVRADRAPAVDLVYACTNTEASTTTFSATVGMQVLDDLLVGQADVALLLQQHLQPGATQSPCGYASVMLDHLLAHVRLQRLAGFASALLQLLVDVIRDVPDLDRRHAIK